MLTKEEREPIYKKGDKFIITVDEVLKGEDGSVLYRMDGFDAAVWSENGLSRLPVPRKRTKVNINDVVMVRLTEKGAQMYYEFLEDIDKILEKYGNGRIKKTVPDIDKHGYLHIQLWKLMSLFGPFMDMTSEPFIQDNEIGVEIK